jgi:hypothetical protein
MANVGAPEDPLAHLSPEEAALFVRFLILIRDNYKKADKAAHFLERRAGVANTCSIANLRDVLSHMATLLDQKTPPGRRSDQLASAEEHLRRAIIEPYEIALAELTGKFHPIYDGYREKVIPINRLEGFRTAPARLVIDGRLEEIDDLAEKGKQAKGRNQWDDEWENGVLALIDAYNKLADLHREIEDWVYKYQQHKTGEHHTWLHRYGIWIAVAGLIVAVAGIAAGYLIAEYPPSPAPPPIISPAVPAQPR